MGEMEVTNMAAGSEGASTVGLIIMVLYFGVLIINIIGAWKVYAKAGQPGWGVLIPIYNIFLVLKIAGRPAWWIILCLIPIVNLITLVIPFDIAKRFGKGAGFGLGLLFLGPIFWPILGLGSAEYTSAD